jgi:hypothetical protein
MAGNHLDPAQPILSNGALRTVLMMMLMTVISPFRTMLMIILNAHGPVLSPLKRRSSG